MTPSKAYEFWKCFDKALGQKPIKDFALDHDLDYVRIVNQRSDCRLPKLEDACALADALGTTVEYLMTGEEPSSRYARIQDIIDWLMAKSDAELDVFRQYNHVPREKEQSSSSRQEA